MDIRKALKIIRQTKLLTTNRYVAMTVLRHIFRRYVSKDSLLINGVELSIDYRCNLRCRHCSAYKFDKMREDKEKMTFKQITSIIDQVKELGGYIVCLVGGEPTLRKDLNDIVGYVRSKKMACIIITNGTVLNDEGIKDLKTAGLFGALVSLNGVGQSHDEFVGSKNAYAKATNTLRLFKMNGVFTKMALVPTHSMMRSGDLDKLLALADEMDISVKFNLPMPVGRLEQEGVSEVLDESELRVIDEMVRNNSNVTTDMIFGKYGKRCPAGNTSIYITEYGDVVPCTFIHISYGNVNEKSLKEIVAKMRKSPYFNDIYHRHCVAARDEYCIKNILRPVWDSNKYPLAVEEHPLFDRKDLGNRSL